MRDRLYFHDSHGKSEVVSLSKATSLIEQMRNGGLLGCTLTDEREDEHDFQSELKNNLNNL